jgi:hypothetical protein
MIITMGHRRNQPSTTDLFSTTPVRDGAPPQVSASKDSASVSQRHVLPRDLPTAVKYLTDAELDLLITTAVDEAKRRGRSPPKIDRNPPDEPKQTRVELAKGSSTRGQISAVQASKQHTRLV